MLWFLIPILLASHGYTAYLGYRRGADVAKAADSFKATIASVKSDINALK